MRKPFFTLSAALAALPGAALAQDDAELAALTKPQSEVSAGLGYWSKDRPRLGTYDGMNQKGPYWLLDALINSRDDAAGTWFTLDARNLGLETRELRAEWQRQGNFGVFMEYGRTPRDEPYSVFTNVRGIGTTSQLVPAVSNTPGGAVHLGTVREAFGVGFSKLLARNYEVRVSVKSEDKTGDRLWGRGGAAEFAAEPIDSNTRQVEAVLAYTTKQLQLQGGYYGSWYTNRNSMVQTDLTSGTNPFTLSLPLDNQAQQLFANGGYNFSERTRGTFKVAYTRATQDEQIPVGPGIAVFPGAPTSLDGRIDTTLMQAGLTSRASDALTWLASLRSYESDEKTPQQRIIQTDPACPTTTSCVDNTPLNFKQLSGKLEATYRLQQGMSVTGGLEQINQERNVPVGTPTAAGDIQRWVPFRSELDETIFRVELRRSLAEALNGRIGYSHGKRDGNDFSFAAADPPDGPTVNNLINPIHLADRDRDKIRLMLDWAPVEPLTLTFSADYAKDKYGHSDSRPFGLREGSALAWSIDAAYAINENWQVTAWYARDETEATQLGQRAASGGAAPALKEATLEDIGDTFGVGLRASLTAQLKAGLDLLYSKNVNRYPETITPVGAGTLFPVSGTVTGVGPLPDITNTLARLNLFAIYALQKNADLRFDFIAERWETDDWSWFFADGTPFTYGGGVTDGTQVAQAAKQNATFLGARYIYRFQ